MGTINKLQGVKVPKEADDSRKKSEAPPLDLTLGVEIECLHLQNTQPQLSKVAEISAHAGREKIHAALSQPVIATCAICKSSHRFHFGDRLNSRMEVGAHHAEDPQYEKWTVDEDNSFGIAQPEADRFPQILDFVQKTSVELISRVMHVSRNLKTTPSDSDPEHMHEITFREEINAVCRRLAEAFNSADGHKDSTLAVNSDCGLHIHIGNGNKGFSQDTINNVLKLLLTFERQIDHLHSSNRIQGSTLMMAKPRYVNYRVDEWVGNCYNMPWSAHMSISAFAHIHAHIQNLRLTSYRFSSEVGSQYPDRRFRERSNLEQASKSFDIPSWLEVIGCAQSPRDLLDIQGVFQHKSTVGLENLESFAPDGVDREAFGNKTMTIEFRQHAGTLQAEEINAWATVLVSLVSFAHETDVADIQKACMENWDNPKFDSRDFLKLIGCPKETRRHYDRVVGRRSAGQGAYAHEVSGKERNAVLSRGLDNFLLPLLCHLVDERTQAMEPCSVGAMIDEKFLAGGYGQFPEAFFKKMVDLPKEAQERLTIGWRPSEDVDNDEGQDDGCEVTERPPVVDEGTEPFDDINIDALQNFSFDEGDVK